MNGHIKHGFLASVYEPWVTIEGSEWGEQMQNLNGAYSMGEDYAGLSFEQLDQLQAMIAEKIAECYDDLLESYPESVAQAREEYQATYDYWYSRALSFKAEDAFRAAEALVPPWMKEE